MIIVRLMGGLGNQMQQYALYKKFIALGKNAKLDLSWFDESVQKNVLAKRDVEIDRFNGVKYETCTDEERESILGKSDFLSKLFRKLSNKPSNRYQESRIYDKALLECDNTYIEGYFACEYYYSELFNELRNEFVLPVKEDLAEISDEIRNCNSVSIHIRRGDYLDAANRAVFGNICTDAYYESAIKYIIDNTVEAEGLVFYIFSDDTEYSESFAENIKAKFGVKAKVVNANSGDDSCYDMHLMSLCKHNICANSTFSFWGARLNSSANKKMIRPTIQKNTQVYDAEMMHELWENWLFISPEGEVC